MRNRFSLLVRLFIHAWATFGTLLAGATVAADDAADFFADGTVHDIHITFDDPGWYDTLWSSHATDPEDPYFPAGFQCDEEILGLVGVRFKGNSSFDIPTVKKSLKIDFNAYDDELRFYGLKKLNLNNGFRDPTLLREKLFLDFAGRFVPALRVTFSRVSINGDYWGLYVVVEQVDETFAQSRFGGNEDGNLWKAAPPDGSGPNSDFGFDLTWLGPEPGPYHDSYQLKTNTIEDDYSQLIEVIDVLNHVDPQDLPSRLEPLLDVSSALTGLALNSLFVNLDSYTGSARNYYLYDRDDTGKITHIHWDTNEAFGRHLMVLPPGTDALRLDPLWLPGPMGPPPGEEQTRPLMENLWARSEYSEAYLCSLQRMLDEGFDVATFQARIDELADLIRADVQADPNMMYSSSEFEQNLWSDISIGSETIYGLASFAERRAAFLVSYLDGMSLQCASPVSDLKGVLFINELMAENDSTIQDPDGTGYSDWIEIYNAGAESVDMGGLYLTDDLAVPAGWQVPAGVLVPAGGFVLFWADNDPDQGPTHADFKLDASGEEVGLVDADGLTEIDSITFGQQLPDVSFGRLPDGSDTWDLLETPTPGSSNSGQPWSATPDLSLAAAARLIGAGAFFTSTLDVFNSGDAELHVLVTYSPRADLGGATRTVAMTVPAGDLLSYDDSLGALFGFDDSDTAVGSLMFTVTDGEASDLLVQSTVVAHNDDGTEYGQAFPAIRTAEALGPGQTAHLSSTVDAERTRVNVGVMALADGTELTITPVDPVGVPLADSRILTLDTGATTQINDLAGSSGFSLGDAVDYVTAVTVFSGRALAYASVLDGTSGEAGTNDPTTILPVGAGAPRLTVLELGTVFGFDEFSGSASVTNLSDQSSEVTIELYLRGEPGVAATTTLTLTAGATFGARDLVGELFGISGVGTVVMSTADGELMATGREYAVLRDNDGFIVGTAGQLMAGLTDQDLLQPGRTYHLLGLTQRHVPAGLERSHVAAFNPGQENAAITLSLFDGASGALEGVLTVTIRAGELDQWNNIVEMINPSQDGLAKRLEVTTNREVFLNAFRVNAHGDPVTIDALCR